MFTKGACSYVPYLLITVNGHAYCKKSNNSLRRKMLLEANPSIIVIHSLLHTYIHGSRNRPHLEQKNFRVQTTALPNSKTSVQDIRDHIHQAVKELLAHGHTVVLIYPIHMADFDVEKQLAKLEEIHPYKRKNLLASNRFSKSYKEFRMFADVAYQIYDSIGDHPNLIRVLPEKLFCNVSGYGHCKIFDQEASLYTDFSHLSYYGACKLVQAIFDALSLTANVRKSRYPCHPACK